MIELSTNEVYYLLLHTITISWLAYYAYGDKR